MECRRVEACEDCVLSQLHLCREVEEEVEVRRALFRSN